MIGEPKGLLITIYKFAYMITEKLIEHITSSIGADHHQVRIAIEQCRAKGVLTKQEVMQLDNQGLPVSMILRTILSITTKDGLDIVLSQHKITYHDLVCMIGIIAQDVKLQQQRR